jgi:chorismate mutase
MAEAVTELLEQMLSRNGIGLDDLISLVFTSTTDLVSAFPATAARALDLADVPLLCAQEIPVTGALSRVVRVMATVQTDLARREVTHVYLRGTEVLRLDLAQ